MADLAIEYGTCVHYHAASGMQADFWAEIAEPGEKHGCLVLDPVILILALLDFGLLIGLVTSH